MTLSFAAFDVETANPARGSICSIGIAIVRDGVRVRTHSLLCRPPAAVDSFAPFNVRVHKITPAAVAGQPTFAERLSEVRALVGDLPVIAHNATFDMNNMMRACEFSGAPLPRWTYGCSLSWSKRQLRLVNYKLSTVSAALGVSLEQHHEAGADAAAAADITLVLARLAGAVSIDELARINSSPLSVLGGVYA
ncbi:exonuclease domain-containing protein [Nocardia sp. NPDC055053]